MLVSYTPAVLPRTRRIPSPPWPDAHRVPGDTAEAEALGEAEPDPRPEEPVDEDEEDPGQRVEHDEIDEAVLRDHDEGDDDRDEGPNQGRRRLVPADADDLLHVSLRHPRADEDREQDGEEQVVLSRLQSYDRDRRDRDAHDRHQDRHPMGLLDPLADEGTAGDEHHPKDEAEHREAEDEAGRKECQCDDHRGEHPEGPHADKVPDRCDDHGGDRDLEEDADQVETVQDIRQVELEVGAVDGEGREERNEGKVSPDGPRTLAGRTRVSLARGVHPLPSGPGGRREVGGRGGRRGGLAPPRGGTPKNIDLPPNQGDGKRKVLNPVPGTYRMPAFV